MWSKIKQNAKKAETATWRALEPVGQMANRASRRLGAEEFWPQDMATECTKAARILRTFAIDGAHHEVDDVATAASTTTAQPLATEAQQAGSTTEEQKKKRKPQRVVKKIPAQSLQGAKGVAIFSMFRTGFGFSGAGGCGVVVARLADGSWSGPSGLLIHTAGVGWTLGLDVYDVVLILRTDAALEAFKKPRLSVGADLAVTAGPIGSGAQMDAGLAKSNTPAWAYVKSKGVYAGAAIEGTIILKRDDENARFYSSLAANKPKPSVAEILSGQVKVPPQTRPLHATLYAAEGRPQAELGEIPQGETVGDFGVAPQATDAEGGMEGKVAPPEVVTVSAADAVPVGIAKRRVPPPPPAAGSSSAAMVDAPPPPTYDDATKEGAALSASEEKERLRKQYEAEEERAARQHE